MKKRRFPRNPECPLTKEERVKLCKALDDLEWQVYLPLKYLTSSYADAIVIEYDELEIEIELEYGSDGSGNHYKGSATISRSDFKIKI
jgi:hypothetical protein